MKLEIETTPKALEMANMILSQGIEQLSKPEVGKAWSVTKTDIKSVEKLREKIVDTLLQKKPT